jgi:hypothetical protein
MIGTSKKPQPRSVVLPKPSCGDVMREKDGEKGVVLRGGTACLVCSQTKMRTSRRMTPPVVFSLERRLA